MQRIYDLDLFITKTLNSEDEKGQQIWTNWERYLAYGLNCIEIFWTIQFNNRNNIDGKGTKGANEFVDGIQNAINQFIGIFSDTFYNNFQERQSCL